MPEAATAHPVQAEKPLRMDLQGHSGKISGEFWLGVSGRAFLGNVSELGKIGAGIVFAWAEGQPSLSLHYLSEIMAFGRPTLLFTPYGQVLGESILYPALKLQLTRGGPYSADVFEVDRRHSEPGQFLFLDGLWSECFWNWIMVVSSPGGAR